MGDIFPVSRDRHGQRTWSKAPGFGFARNQQMVVISLQEAPQLMMLLPLGFLKQGEHFHFIALLGLRPGENVWVGGADNRWLGQRVPTILQNYPFKLLRSPDGRDMLGVDEEGLLPPGTPGVPLFNDDGTPLPELSTIVEQLAKADKERQASVQVSALLARYELLEPWPLQFQEESRIRTVDGLYRVSERKLNELPPEAFLALRTGGGLLMAYTQLLAMQHVHQLGRMADALMAAKQRMPQPGKDLVSEHGIISFANL